MLVLSVGYIDGKRVGMECACMLLPKPLRVNADRS